MSFGSGDNVGHLAARDCCQDLNRMVKSKAAPMAGTEIIEADLHTGAA